MTQHQKRLEIIQKILELYVMKYTNEIVIRKTLDDELFSSEMINTVEDILKKRTLVEDKITQNLQKWTWDRMHNLEKSILLVAGYEIIYTNLDNGICINEAINISKKYCDPRSYKMINAVLDKLK